MGYKLTEIQAKLWHLSNKKMDEIAKKFGNPIGGYEGGFSAITRIPDISIRNAVNTTGTVEWALLEAGGLSGLPMNKKMTDEYCQKLIDIIEGKDEKWIYEHMQSLVISNSEDENQCFFENFNAGEYIKVNRLENISIKLVEKIFERIKGESK